MAQKDPDTGPSLELPSLFGRRKRRTQESGDTTTVPTSKKASDDAPEPTDVAAPEAPEAAEPEPTDVAAPEAPEAAEPESPEAAEPEAPEVAEPEATTETAAAEHTAVIPVVEEPPAPEPVVDESPTRAEPAQPPTPPPAAPRVAPTPAATPTAVPSPSKASDEADRAPREGGRRARAGSRQAPEVGAPLAALVVGAAVGLMGCLLTYVGLQGCELVTGTGSCGGPGLLVLVVILVVMVLAGAAALRWLRVSDAGNLSFLGVGMMTVVALLFLIDYLYDPWMLVVIPAVNALTFLAAQWVTTRYTEDMFDDDDDGMPHHDIR